MKYLMQNFEKIEDSQLNKILIGIAICLTASLVTIATELM